jgi:hypothetical protein
MRKLLNKFLPDALLVVGAAGVSYGAWLAYEPAGYVVAGALAIVAGLKLAAA